MSRSPFLPGILASIMVSTMACMLVYILAAGLPGVGEVSAQQPPAIVPIDPPPGSSADPFGADWPQGEGRMITGAACVTCHSLAIVKQQGLSRKRWDYLLDWMVEEHDMPEYDPKTRGTILDFLTENFGYEDSGPES